MHKGDIVKIKDYQFWTGEIKDKYIVILSDRNKYLDIVFVFTTSQTEKYSSLGKENIVCIPEGTIECFDKETFIVVHNIHQEFQERLLSYDYSIVGVLSEDLFNEIIEKAKNCKLIRPYIKQKL